MMNAMTNEEAIVQLEIDATNLVGRLASEPVHDTSFSELWTRKLEAIDIAIYAIKMFDKHEAECERCACNLLAERDALKERTRWIPVSEILPNMCGFKCLVCAKNKFEQTHVFTAFTGYMEHGKLEFHSCEPPYDDLSAWEITHWMPLPEAPKEAQS